MAACIVKGGLWPCVSWNTHDTTQFRNQTDRYRASPAMVPFSAVALGPGSIINEKYRIVRLVDERGVGAVYEGRRLRGDGRVAIKVLRRKFSEDKEWIARFERETAVAARMNSARLARFLDVGVLPDRRRFMVMEYLEGEKLSTRMERVVHIPPKVMVDLILQLLEALQQVHDAKIVHRGISPTSVFLQKMGRLDYVCLLDFGVCKDMTDKLRDINTAQGRLLSTVAYSAPEALARGSGQADHRSDLFSVGVLLYRGISGVAPFPAQEPQQLLNRLRAGPPMPLSQATDGGVDRVLSDIAQKALERTPDARFKTAEEMSDALNAWLLTAGPAASRRAVPTPPTSIPVSGPAGVPPSVPPPISAYPAPPSAPGSRRGSTLRLPTSELQARTRPPPPMPEPDEEDTITTQQPALSKSPAPAAVQRGTVRMTVNPPLSQPPPPSTSAPVSQQPEPPTLHRPRRK